MTTDPSLAVDVIAEVAKLKPSVELAMVVSSGGVMLDAVGSPTPPATAFTVTVNVDTPLVASVLGSRSSVTEEPSMFVIVVTEARKVSGVVIDAAGSATPPATALTVTVNVDNPPVASVLGSRSSVTEEPSAFVIVVTKARKVSPSLCALAW